VLHDPAHCHHSTPTPRNRGYMLAEMTVPVVRNFYARTGQRTLVVKFIIFNKNYKETW
jgi:hypothetical protein